MITKVAAIRLAVEHGKLKILKDYTPSTDTCNGVRVDIEFRTEEWSELAKTVGFYRGDLAYGQIIQDGETSCLIPWEILDVHKLCDCDFYINVIGTAGNGTVLTTNRVHFKIALGGYDELLVSSEPTPTLYEQLRDLMQKFDPSGYATIKYVDQQIANSVITKSTFINLPATNWFGTANLYSQVITIDGVTETSKIDLQPTAEQLAELQAEEISLVAANDAGVITVYAIGYKPTVDYTIQATITEVVVQ